jgi:hypothetical protein
VLRCGGWLSRSRRRGYYRPEDIDIDTTALAAGKVRFCGNYTGRDSSRYFGEVICFTDGTIAASASGSTTPEVILLVRGSQEINMPDNIAFEARRGNWIVHEDGSTAGAPGGGDRKQRSLELSGRRPGRRHPLRRLCQSRHAQRPGRRMDRRVLRPAREALLCQRPAQLERVRDDSGHHRLALVN